MGSDEVLAVTLPIKEWVLIDGTLDNLAAVAVIDNPSLAGRARLVRTIGWDQVPDWPGAGEDMAGWPPEGQDCTVSMSRSLWELVLKGLADAIPINQSLAEAKQLPLEERRVHTDAASQSLQVSARLRTALQ